MNTKMTRIYTSRCTSRSDTQPKFRQDLQKSERNLVVDVPRTRRLPPTSFVLSVLFSVCVCLHGDDHSTKKCNVTCFIQCTDLGFSCTPTAVLPYSYLRGT